MLLEHGADPKQKDQTKRTARDRLLKPQNWKETETVFHDWDPNVAAAAHPAIVASAIFAGMVPAIFAIKAPVMQQPL